MTLLVATEGYLIIRGRGFFRDYAPKDDTPKGLLPITHFSAL